MTDHQTNDAGSVGAPLSVTEASRAIASLNAKDRAEWEASFWARVDRETDPDGCWHWTRAKAGEKCGYGYVRVAGAVVGVHCAAYVLARGPVKKKLVVRHGPQCEEHGPKGLLCVNPEHLEVGTHGDNMDDRNGGWFRLDLDDIPMSAGVRDGAKAFMPHALAVLAVSDVHPATGSGEGQLGDGGKALTAEAAERDRKGR